MSINEYWIGQGIDFRSVWQDYDEGSGYQDKYQRMNVHLLQFDFASDPHIPLFNHEAVFKTMKGYFHELKQACLPRHDYEQAGPLFLYEIERGSSLWSFLGELRQLLLLGTTLADQKVVGQQLKNLDLRLSILKKHFGNSVRPEDFHKFMNARTPPEVNEAVQRMVGEGLRRVRISKRPFKEDPDSAKEQMIDLKEINPK